MQKPSKVIPRAWHIKHCLTKGIIECINWESYGGMLFEKAPCSARVGERTSVVRSQWFLTYEGALQGAVKKARSKVASLEKQKARAEGLLSQWEEGLDRLERLAGRGDKIVMSGVDAPLLTELAEFPIKGGI